MRRKPPVDLSTMVYGKVPPQAKELEEAVLGAIMLEKSAFDTVVEILKPECFYLEGHQRIFKAMQSLAQKSQPIDILTVVEELKTRVELEMVGGPYFVTRLTNSVVSSANIETHARITSTHVAHAASEQRGGREQHEGDADLEHDQCRADARAPHAARARAPALREHPSEVDAGRTHHRQRGEGHHGQHRGREGERQGAAIESEPRPSRNEHGEISGDRIADRVHTPPRECGADHPRDE